MAQVKDLDPECSNIVTTTPQVRALCLGPPCAVSLPSLTVRRPYATPSDARHGRPEGNATPGKPCTAGCGRYDSSQGSTRAPGGIPNPLVMQSRRVLSEYSAKAMCYSGTPQANLCQS